MGYISIAALDLLPVSRRSHHSSVVNMSYALAFCKYLAPPGDITTWPIFAQAVVAVSYCDHSNASKNVLLAVATLKEVPKNTYVPSDAKVTLLDGIITL